MLDLAPVVLDDSFGHDFDFYLFDHLDDGHFVLDFDYPDDVHDDDYALEIYCFVDDDEIVLPRYDCVSVESALDSCSNSTVFQSV